MAKLATTKPDQAVSNSAKKVKVVVDGIKRPKNAYMWYANEMRPKVIEEHPDVKSKVSEMSKLISKHWKALDSVERKKYEDMAAQDKERYAREKAGGL